MKSSIAPSSSSNSQSIDSSSSSSEFSLPPPRGGGRLQTRLATTSSSRSHSSDTVQTKRAPIATPNSRQTRTRQQASPVGVSPSSSNPSAPPSSQSAFAKVGRNVRGGSTTNRATEQRRNELTRTQSNAPVEEATPSLPAAPQPESLVAQTENSSEDEDVPSASPSSSSTSPSSSPESVSLPSSPVASLAESRRAQRAEAMQRAIDRAKKSLTRKPVAPTKTPYSKASTSASIPTRANYMGRPDAERGQSSQNQDRASIPQPNTYISPSARAKSNLPRVSTPPPSAVSSSDATPVASPSPSPPSSVLSSLGSERQARRDAIEGDGTPPSQFPLIEPDQAETAASVVDSAQERPLQSRSSNQRSDQRNQRLSSLLRAKVGANVRSSVRAPVAPAPTPTSPPIVSTTTDVTDLSSNSLVSQPDLPPADLTPTSVEPSTMKTEATEEIESAIATPSVETNWADHTKPENERAQQVTHESKPMSDEEIADVPIATSSNEFAEPSPPMASFQPPTASLTTDDDDTDADSVAQPNNTPVNDLASPKPIPPAASLESTAGVDTSFVDSPDQDGSLVRSLRPLSGESQRLPTPPVLPSISLPKILPPVLPLQPTTEHAKRVETEPIQPMRPPTDSEATQDSPSRLSENGDSANIPPPGGAQELDAPSQRVDETPQGQSESLPSPAPSSPIDSETMPLPSNPVNTYNQNRDNTNDSRDSLRRSSPSRTRADSSPSKLADSDRSLQKSTNLDNDKPSVRPTQSRESNPVPPKLNESSNLMPRTSLTPSAQLDQDLTPPAVPQSSASRPDRVPVDSKPLNVEPFTPPSEKDNPEDVTPSNPSVRADTNSADDAAEDHLRTPSAEIPTSAAQSEPTQTTTPKSPVTDEEIVKPPIVKVFPDNEQKQTPPSLPSPPSPPSLPSFPREASPDDISPVSPSSSSDLSASDFDSSPAVTWRPVVQQRSTSPTGLVIVVVFVSFLMFVGLKLKRCLAASEDEGEDLELGTLLSNHPPSASPTNSSTHAKSSRPALRPGQVHVDTLTDEEEMEAGYNNKRNEASLPTPSRGMSLKSQPVKPARGMSNKKTKLGLGARQISDNDEDDKFTD